MADNVQIAADDVGGVAYQRIKLAHGTDGAAVDASATNPLPVGLVEAGTYGYAAGTAAGTVDVPAAARLRRVSVLAGAGLATVTIGGGAVITLVAGGVFDEQIPGAAIGADVILGGDVDAYYVAWTV